jgi:hypothetical protein
VWLVRGPRELNEVADRLDRSGLLDGGHEVLVQQPAAGVLGVVQSVFQHGRLLGAHCYQARALGVGGSARAREGVANPVVLEHLATLGARLNWHGALMLDYLFDPATGQPAYIDANPRIGETLNATLSGLNLAELLVQVSLGRTVAPPPPSRPGVRTHSVVTGLLGAAQRGQGRRHLLAELWRAWTRQGVYAGSRDELTRPREDPLSLVPAAFLSLRLLGNPRAAGRIVARTVENYGLTESTAHSLRRMPADVLGGRNAGPAQRVPA